MTFTVHIGYIADELADFRTLLLEQVTALGMQPSWMNDADLRQANLAEVVQARLQAADAVLILLTYQRGWGPATDERSLLQMEYDAAQALAKPLTALMPKDNTSMSRQMRLRAWRDQTAAEALLQRAFWARVEQTAQVLRFADEAELSIELRRLLVKWSVKGQEPLVAPSPLMSFAQEMPNAEVTRSEQAPLPAVMDVNSLADAVANRTVEKIVALQAHQQADLAQEAMKINEALALQPGELVFGRPAMTRQFKSDVFMIMPFRDELKGVYSDVVKPLLAELKLTVQRGDDFTSIKGAVMEEVWAALNACRFVIADLTGGNDNVFYELGIAHTLNKPAILIIQSTAPEDVPFDVRHLRYIRYANTIDGGDNLREDLRKAITRLLADLGESWGKAT